MFNWVCPRCGKDVPPSKTVCPYCAEQPPQVPPAAGPQQGLPQGYPTPQGMPAQAPPQAWQPPRQWTPPPPPPTPQYEPQPVAAHPQPPSGQPAWQPQPPYNQHQQHDPAAAHAHWPRQKQGPPAWLVGTGVAVLLIAILGAAYYYMQPATGKITDTGEKAQPAAAAPAGQAANPYQKYMEVVGVRLVTEKGKPVARVVVVNHSPAEINGLEANITLWASTKRSEEDSIGSFKIKVPKVGANGSFEASAPLTTKLKSYELPDWQNLTAEMQITSPKP